MNSSAFVTLKIFGFQSESTPNAKFTFSFHFRYGRLEVARYLVEQGANVSTRSIGGFLPVHVAAQYGHFDLLKFLGGNSIEKFLA